VVNRLASSTSPYLQQHADNPVDWWQWSPEAFAEARSRDVPVLLSIGYSACHWCHVMAHESFEDPLTAAVLNADYVCIKVDREERPDIDAVYMTATTALTGHGGWPMTVVLDHDGRPFYAGTYFPPTPRQGMPAFRQVLAAVTEAWRDDRPRVLAAAGAIEEALARHAAGLVAGPGEAPVAVDVDLAARAVGVIAEQVDPHHGGFGGAPKFPPSMVLTWLLGRVGRTGDEQAYRIAAATAEAMARGGITDQLGGGFARYAVDAAWVVPHFEKMLYDNALLLRAYDSWWRVAPDPAAREFAARVCEQTAGFLLRELRTPEGGFASALDADSCPPEEPGAPAEEGAFYVWSPAQLQAVLGPEDGRWAAEQFHVTGAGTFEHGTSTLQRRSEPSDPVRYARVCAALRAAREQRPRPARDDKVIASWNALAIGALIRAGVAHGRPDWCAAAAAAADLLLQVHLTHDGTRLRLHRVSRDGRVGQPQGVLEDYAHTATALAHLGCLTGEQRWLASAVELAASMRALFAVEGDAGTLRWFDTAHDAEQLIRRPYEPADNATPAGPAAAAEALLTVGALTGDVVRTDEARATLLGLGGLCAAAPRLAGAALAVLEGLLDGPQQIVVVDRPAGTDLGRALLAAAAACPGPAAIVVRATHGDAPPPALAHLLTGRVAAHAPAPIAYPCRAGTCAAPTADPAALRRV